jgi:hypothetical protein
MSETYAILTFITERPETLERIRVYLNEDTRPDFEDEVPISEAVLFKVMEFADTPQEIVQSNDHQLYSWYEFIEEDDIATIFKAFDELDHSIRRYGFFADDEEYKVYFKYADGKLTRIYTIEDDEDVDDKLWEMEWNEKALDWIIEHKG